MRAIFICYRRDDTEGQAGRLYDDLVSQFGEKSVFMDVVAVDAGRDFRRAIDENVSSCGVLLALIGKNWVNAKRPDGHRRLDDPADFVRLEASSALKRDIPVVPVLVQGATMPSEGELPGDLKDLAYRNAVELSHTRWDSDVQVLIKSLRHHVGAENERLTKTSGSGPVIETSVDPTREPTRSHKTESRSPTKLIAVALTAIVAIASLVYFLRPTALEVPDVVGLSLSSASKVLAGKHLVVGTIQARADARAAAGTVLQQVPSAGEKVKSGSGVELVIAATGVRVPKIVGKTEQQARDTLRVSGLSLGVTENVKQGDVSAGTVVSQTPEAGTVAEAGTSVGVHMAEAVSKSADTPQPESILVVVPDLTSKDVNAATQLIRQAGLSPGAIDKIPSGTTPGIVLAQDPAAGKRLARGSAVGLTVSVVPTVVVPNVFKKTLSDARADIERAGLVAIFIPEDGEPSIPEGGKTVAWVVKQQPAAGEMVKKGQSVSLQYMVQRDTTNPSPPPKRSGEFASSTITVLDGTYGQNCGSETSALSATGDLARMCNGKDLCTYPVSARRLRAQRKGSCQNSFVVNYRCGDKNEQVVVPPEADGQYATLSCR